MGSVATTRRLSVKQGNGRIANAIADLLSRKLTVPEIYMRPRVPGLSGVDVLAVNHAGSGDIHGVEIIFSHEEISVTDLKAKVAAMKILPLHYRYLALPDPTAKLSAVATLFSGGLVFDASGLGRLGLIAYPVELLEEEAVSPSINGEARLLVKPERFLLRGEKLATMEKFLSGAEPDMRVRI